MKWFTPKYRIKKVTDGNDNITYYPQRKTWYGCWINFSEINHCFGKFPKKCSYPADAESYIKEYHHWWLSQQIKKIEYINITI